MIDFIPWGGGKIPVPPNTLIDYVERSGITFLNTYARFALWERDRYTGPDKFDCMAYRICEKTTS